MIQMKGFQVIPPEDKLKRDLLPYLSFPLTKSCNFRCVYCGTGGEATASKKPFHDYDFVVSRARLAISRGIVKFRLTGGEPFVHPRIGDLIRFFSDLGCYLLVNTNASLIRQKHKDLESIGTNVHFAASLDTLVRENFSRISGTDLYSQVIDGIQYLADTTRLLRINMVVSEYNKDEVFSMIDFCRKLGCHLKLLDVVSVPLPYSSRDNIHINLDDVELRLAEKSDAIELHDYARSFGTPCRIYVINGVRVTVKSTSHGSRYDSDGICKDCPYFPCHEGLYDFLLLPDGKLCGCRWSLTSVSQFESFEPGLAELIGVFQRATWVEHSLPTEMSPAPDIVLETGLYSDWVKCR